MGYFGTPLILLLMLVGPFIVFTVLDRVSPLFRFSLSTAGCIGLATLFVFTGIGHFVKTEPMVGMLPGFVPFPAAMVYLTGLLEMAAGVAILFASARRQVAWVLIVLLVLLAPFNIYAAFREVGPGGHVYGPSYLWIRIPLQLFFIAWTYWFGVHLVNRAIRLAPAAAEGGVPLER